MRLLWVSNSKSLTSTPYGVYFSFKISELHLLLSQKNTVFFFFICCGVTLAFSHIFLLIHLVCCVISSRQLPAYPLPLF